MATTPGGTVSPEAIARAKSSRLGRTMAAVDQTRYNGQALVAALVAVTNAARVKAGLDEYPFDIAARNASRDVHSAIEDVQRYARPLQGVPDGPVSAPSWRDLRQAILRLYSLLYAIETALPPEQRETLGALLAQVAVDSAKALPEVIGQAGTYVAEVAENIAAAPGKVVTGAVGGFLKEAWPVLVGVAALIGVGLYLAFGTETGGKVTRLAVTKGAG